MNRKIMILPKKAAAAGENLYMMYRLILITVIAFVLIGSANFLYSHDINVRHIEAQQMERAILLCMTNPEITHNFDFSSDTLKYSFLEVCGYPEDLKNVYARVTFINKANNERLFTFEDGDSGAAWYRRLARDESSSYKYLQPGKANRSYGVYFKDTESKRVMSGTMRVEVLINAQT